MFCLKFIFVCEELIFQCKVGLHWTSKNKDKNKKSISTYENRIHSFFELCPHRMLAFVLKFAFHGIQYGS